MFFHCIKTIKASDKKNRLIFLINFIKNLKFSNLAVFEEAFNQGYPHELKHFIECVQQDKEPVVTGEDGRAVLEIIYAAYASAAEGKKIMLPFTPKVSKPIDLWLGTSESM
ncbi:MAG TPA: Gfo/Idh/MocA family oxidoreductase [Chitinophagaceae bacterium]|nr:Gfo/Idh/MocA family oxidoreductase [Chitinophagaceae bacterium]